MYPHHGAGAFCKVHLANYYPKVENLTPNTCINVSLHSLSLASLYAMLNLSTILVHIVTLHQVRV